MNPLVIRGMQGLGDNLYQRAVVREVAGRDVYLHTPWPQLYAGLPIRCLPPQTKLRTQLVNVARSAHLWDRPPRGGRQVQLSYINRAGTVLKALGDCLGVSARTFDAPDFMRPACAPAGSYVVVRPATVRAEWRADNRNPRPEYIDRAARAAADAGFKVVSLAYLAERHEWLAGDAPYAHIRWHSGELGIEQLFGLVQHAAGCIGGVGWLLPASIAYRVPMLLLYGGQGTHNGPQRVLDPIMSLDQIEQAMPDRLCNCATWRHDCVRTITDLEEHIGRWLVRCDARRAPAVAPGVGHRVVSGECVPV